MSHDEISELRRQLARKELEMQSMQQIGKVLSSVLNREKLLILIMKEVTRLIHAERSTLYVVDQEMGELWSKIAQKAEIKEIRLKIETGIAGHVAKTGEVINIRDAYQDDRFDPTTDKKTGYKTRSILCMPIREPVREEGRTGNIIAVIQVLNKVDGHFTASDEDLLSSLGSQIAISLANARLYSILEDRVNELNLLFDLEKELSRAQDQHELLKKLLELIAGSLNAQYGILVLRNKDDEQFSLRFSYQLNDKKLSEAEIDCEKGIIGRVCRSKEIYLSNQAADDPDADQELEKCLDITMRHVLCAPLVSDDKVIGVIELMNRKGENAYFSNNDRAILQSVAGQMARGIDNFRLKEERVKADRLATIGNMMSTIVHDLRTPMNNIYGFVDLMLEEEDTATRKEYADIINEQINILTNMTTDVLDFAKGKTTILPRKYPADRLVKDFVRFFEADIRRRGFQFDWQVDVSGMVYVDPEKINRVFMNIMKNALEAMSQGGMFRIAALAANGEIKFSLSDTGSGIPDEIRDRLFDSFVTSGKEGGTGLGLAIVKKVIDEHKGRIEVESQPGKGTTFNLYFQKV